MSFSNTINCYCFNPECEKSIFRMYNYVVVKELLSKVLTQPIFCACCNSELIAKPILDILLQTTRPLSSRAKLKAIFIDDDPFFLKIIRHSLKRATSINHTQFSLNGLDVIKYLKLHRNTHDRLPDLIFVDINMPVMNGWEFLEEFEKLYVELTKKSRVYMTSSNIMPIYKVKTRKYRFVKGLISKPFNVNTLQNIAEFELCYI